MHWYIVGNGFDHPSAAPDIVFDDASFTPLTNGRANHDLVALMEGWNAAKAPACLQQLLERLSLLYLQHQKAKIAALEDDRILFELSMLDELGCNEVLLACEWTKTHFTVQLVLCRVAATSNSHTARVLVTPTVKDIMTCRL
jgi:hypothetical protein